MITYEEAKERAKRIKGQIDNCTEYEDAYVFGFSGDDNFIGGATPCVILIENGRALSMLAYLESGSKTPLSEWKLEE